MEAKQQRDSWPCRDGRNAGPRRFLPDWRGLLAVMVGILALSVRTDAASAMAPTPTADAASSRAKWESMSDAELLSSFGPDGPTILEVLRVRWEKYSPEERESLLEEFRKKAATVPPGLEYRRFCRTATMIFPQDVSRSLLVELLGRTGDIDDLEFLANTYLELYHKGTDPEAAEVFFAAVSKWYEEERSGAEPTGRYGQVRVLMMALGHCGEPALEKVLQLPWKAPDGLYALAKIGTPAALGHIMDLYTQTTLVRDKLECLGALGLGDPSRYPQEVKDFLWRNLEPFLCDPDPIVRQNAVEIGELAGDKRALPILRRIAETDPEMREVTRWVNGVEDTRQRYVIREAAGQAIERILSADAAWRAQQARLREIAELEKHLASNEEEKPQLPHEEARQSVERDSEETRKKLEALRAEVAAAEPSVPKP